MPKLPPHLRSLPHALAASLTAEHKRQLADLRTDRERDTRARDARGWANGPEGMDALPGFLRAIEAEHPRAADLWLNLRPGSTLAEARELGQRYGLSAEATDRALAALRRAELLATEGEGDARRFASLAPASVPF